MSNEMYEIDKYTLDTMIYFCFGITIDDDIDTILTYIVKKAMSDATGQGAFNSKIKKKRKTYGNWLKTQKMKP